MRQRTWAQLHVTSRVTVDKRHLLVHIVLVMILNKQQTTAFNTGHTFHEVPITPVLRSVLSGCCGGVVEEITQGGRTISRFA